jgi:hypothetical protein
MAFLFVKEPEMLLHFAVVRGVKSFLCNLSLFYGDALKKDAVVQ